MLLKALDQLTTTMDFKLTIVSNPNPKYVESLRASVSAEMWRRVEFKYDLPPEDVARELETSTMLLLPTRADTSPNAVKEAGVAGVPVVASNVAVSRITSFRKKRLPASARRLGGVRGSDPFGVYASALQARRGGRGNPPPDAGIFVSGKDGEKVSGGARSSA